MVIQGRNILGIVYVFSVSLYGYWQDFPPDWDLIISFIMVGDINIPFHKGLAFYSSAQLFWDLGTYWWCHWCTIMCFGFRHGINMYVFGWLHTVSLPVMCTLLVSSKILNPGLKWEYFCKFYPCVSFFTVWVLVIFNCYPIQKKYVFVLGPWWL